MGFAAAQAHNTAFACMGARRQWQQLAGGNCLLGQSAHMGALAAVVLRMDSKESWPVSVSMHMATILFILNRGRWWSMHSYCLAEIASYSCALYWSTLKLARNNWAHFGFRVCPPPAFIILHPTGPHWTQGSRSPPFCLCWRLRFCPVGF